MCINLHCISFSGKLVKSPANQFKIIACRLSACWLLILLTPATEAGHGEILMFSFNDLSYLENEDLIVYPVNCRCNTSLLIDYCPDNTKHSYILIDVGKTFREQVLRWFTLYKIPCVNSVSYPLHFLCMHDSIIFINDLLF